MRSSFTASTVTAAGIADKIISFLTGHKSRELRRYRHLRDDPKRGTDDLIARVLEEAGRRPQDTAGESGSRLLHTTPKNGDVEDRN